MKYLSVIMVSILLTSPAIARVSCKSFKTQAEAQAYFVAKKAGYKNLDRDGDGRACDCNLGGNGKNCPQHKKR